MNDAIPQGSEWNELINAFSDPQRLHAIMVHLPIAIAALGLLLVLGVIVTGGKSAGLRWTTVFVFLIGTLAALWTVQTGEEAAHALQHADRLPQVDVADDASRAERLEDPAVLLQYHHDLAEYFWIGLGTVALLIMLAGIRVTWWKTLVLLLALIVSAANVVWVGVINHYGGKMVYIHEVGVPSPYPNGMPEHEHDDDDHDEPEDKDHGVKVDDKQPSDKDKSADGEKDDSKLRDAAKKAKDPEGPSKLFNGDGTDGTDGKDGETKDGDAKDGETP